MRRRIVLLALVVLVAATASGCGYNTLTTKHENVKAKWANVETQLQRRSDLLNNLIETAKLAGVQEQEVFGKIAEARSKLLNATRKRRRAKAATRRRSRSRRLLMRQTVLAARSGGCWHCRRTIHSYGPMKNFLKAQDEVVGTETRIATARKDYNDATQDYNTTMKSFPTVISAKLFGFKEEPYFKAEEGATAVPKIDSNSLRAPTPAK